MTRTPRRRTVRSPQTREEVDSARFTAYMDHRRLVGEGLIRAAMRALAANEAASTVNSILEDRYNLGSVHLDVAELSMFTGNILRIEVASLLAEHSEMTDVQQKEFVERIIARIVPKRDNVPGATTTPMQRQTPVRIEDVEHVIQREMRRSDIRHSNRLEGE